MKFQGSVLEPGNANLKICESFPLLKGDRGSYIYTPRQVFWSIFTLLSRSLSAEERRGGSSPRRVM